MQDVPSDNRIGESIRLMRQWTCSLEFGLDDFLRRGRSKRQKKLAEIAVQRTVLAAAALLMAGGKAKNDDDTDNNAEADGRQSGPPSGDAYTDWVLLVLRSMREAGRQRVTVRAATGPQLGKAVAWRGQASHGDGVASNGPLP